MEEAPVREEKFHIYLNDDEYSRLIQSLIRLKNSLTAQGRCTDAVDDILYKVLSAKRRKFKIKGPVKNYAQNCLQAPAE